ncbi:4915_t:CDS:2 [Funneliformis caledonium]|uniref:4915_t:CDS:1 n=1 Tax=Funneliformis caledonium TaxID=1117310 RepID=A0A9N8ZA63_9GLOM|nr:4915_t:CDS:2 [Funneliformis caledonium]
MNSYPYFTLQQKLENIDSSLKETIQHYIRLIIDSHSTQNNDIIKSNTSYALQLRESEIKTRQLQAEYIELRVTVAQLRAKIEKLKHKKASTNDNFKESVKSASDKIIALVQQLQGAADSLSTIVDPESTRGSSFISDVSSILGSSIDLTNGGLGVASGSQYSELMSNMDITLDILPHKKKPVNLLAVYRKKPKALVSINEFNEEQKYQRTSAFASSSHKPELVEEEPLQLEIADTDHKFQRVQAKIPQKLKLTTFAKTESTSKQKLDETNYASQRDQVPQYRVENLSMDIVIDQVEQESKYSERTRGDVVDGTTSSAFQQQAPIIASSLMTTNNEHSLVPMTVAITPFQKESYEPDNSQKAEESLQNIGVSEKYKKKRIREPEWMFEMNEGESRGRKRFQVNYAEPNLRSKLRRGDPHTYTLETDSRK